MKCAHACLFTAVWGSMVNRKPGTSHYCSAVGVTIMKGRQLTLPWTVTVDSGHPVLPWCRTETGTDAAQLYWLHTGSDSSVVCCTLDSGYTTCFMIWGGWGGWICHGATRGVTVSVSAFLACHQCYCVGSSLAWGLNLRAVVCGIFWSSSPGVFSGYSSFLPSFIGLMVQPIK